MGATAAISSANAATLAAFGEDVIVAGEPASGIYSGPYQASDMINGIIESYAPTLVVADAVAASVSHGTAVVVRGETFYAIGVQPDGMGMTKLILSESSGV